MPSGAYGRGGGNFVKKPKSLGPALFSDTSTKSSSLKSSEKVSLLKKIVHAMPGSGSQSNKSQARTSGGQPIHRDRDTPTQHPNNNPRQRQTRGSTLPARSKASLSHLSAPLRISFADDASHPVMDPTHRNGRTPAVNLHMLTPSSSEDESSDSEHSVRPLSPIGILPFTSARQMSTDNEGTAVNESPFSAPEVLPRTVKAPPLTVTGNRVRVRSSSLNDGFLKRTAPSQPQPQPQPKPEREVEDLNRQGDQKKALAVLEGNLGSPNREGGKGNPNHRPVINDSKYKRERRITLATTTTISRIPPTPAPDRRPISELSSFTDLLPSSLNEHTQRWSENIISVSGSGLAAPSDPFNHLFTSCVISLILLIILAAGKDILYVVALLPVLMTLAKHFLDLNQLGLYTPLMRMNLESLLSI